MEALRQIEAWPASHASVGVTMPDGMFQPYGDDAHGSWTRCFELASVTKLATALVVLAAAEEGVVDLDEPAGPEGSTVRHLLAHASGLGPEPGAPIARPGERRIYSNYGFDVLADHVARCAEMKFSTYFKSVLIEHDIWIDLPGSAGSSGRGSLKDVLGLAHLISSPGLLAAETVAEMTDVQFPGLAGVLPGFGRQEPNDWGLGVELRNGKTPHWTGSRNSTRTFGHFGQTGTFLWVDPEAGIALACLTDLTFGDWAKEAWPKLADAVLAEAGGSA